MPYDLEFTVRVTAQDEQEAMKLQEAVFSGYAAEIMRIGVLYGQIPVGGAVPYGSAPQPVSASGVQSHRGSDIEVTRVASREASVKPAESEKKQVQPRGLAGRRRLGRT